MINLAIVVTNNKLAQYVTSNEDEFIQAIFDDLPHTYTKYLNLYLMANGRIRPHTWTELQDMIQLAWNLRKQGQKRFHPSRDLPSKSTASQLMGQRINAMRQRQHYRNYNRGSRGARNRGYRGYNRGYNNQGYRGQQYRGRGYRGRSYQ